MMDDLTTAELVARILSAAEKCPACGSVEVDEPPELQAPPMIRVCVCLDCGEQFAPSE